MWYMKYKETASMGHTRFLTKTKRDLLKDFQKNKSESQCITKIKDIKKQLGDNVWDYDQQFKILLNRLTFQIKYVQHREWFIADYFPIS
jgi:hypothetical protein